MPRKKAALKPKNKIYTLRYYFYVFRFMVNSGYKYYNQAGKYI